jgi:hypothetical protein
MTTGVAESTTYTTKTLNFILSKHYFLFSIVVLDALSILTCGAARLEAQSSVFSYPTGPSVCPL